MHIPACRHWSGTSGHDQTCNHICHTSTVSESLYIRYVTAHLVDAATGLARHMQYLQQTLCKLHRVHFARSVFSTQKTQKALHTLSDFQAHAVLWQHVVTADEGLLGLKHDQSTVGSWSVLPI